MTPTNVLFTILNEARHVAFTVSVLVVDAGHCKNVCVIIQTHRNRNH